MKKFFNTTGPCQPANHYMLDPLEWADDMRTYIDRELYFVVHAPRQSGKTTLLERFSLALTAEGTYASIRVSCEVGQPFRSDFGGAELALLSEIRAAAMRDLSEDMLPPPWPDSAVGTRLKGGLAAWAKACPRPLVLMLDEIDALTDESLESVLRQLRSGFSDRPQNFPHSIILCGLRDVRDYKVASGGSLRLGTASPFNIKVASLRLGNFSQAQVANLYAQHTLATGQAFSPEALQMAWELTSGQPWLVNALASEVVDRKHGPANEPITAAQMEEAAQRLILARATHLDSLVSKLQEDRVQRVLTPLLAGTLVQADKTYNDDVLYVRDLGLVSQDAPVRIVNSICREVIVRELLAGTSDSIVFQRPSFVDVHGHLDIDAIVSEFAAWWKTNGGAMLHGHVYHEVAAQLIFMAWLQRVVNGGGLIDREYGVGRGRIDILIRWRLPGTSSPPQWQREAFELKAWAPGKPDPLPEGLAQLDRYLEGLGLTQGTLVIFDRRPDAPDAAERTSVTEVVSMGRCKVRVLRA